jgi:hypothetical protein
VSINFTSNTGNRAFQAYVNGVFHMAQSMSQGEFDQRNGTYQLSYQILGAGISVFSAIAIPILQSDTVKAGVHFQSFSGISAFNFLFINPLPCLWQLPYLRRLWQRQRKRKRPL